MSDLIANIASEVRKKLQGEGSGHDWWHIERVWKNAKLIGKKEKVDMQIVELAALLHDIADWKFHNGDLTVGPRVARELLEKYQAPKEVIAHVCDIVAHVSFKGAKVADVMHSLEGKVVQDADRLDAIGAIGVARAFAYGGHANRALYDPTKKAELHTSPEAYHKSDNSTVNHFYEKLLLLKDRMWTKTGKKVAAQRHAYMKKYLEQFFAEWEGTR